jgi:catechol 2,3-dioxygenase-like lactoylglutathione lyase family enzyme|tara:strand:+ start:23102 stop:23506 length:405 start_codon:yes stop_codon:yes gene_type:complete
MPPRAGVLRHILLLQRDVPLAAAFYERALGLRVTVCTETYAELASESPSDSTASNAPIGASLALQRADAESQLTPGYSPIIHFEVDDIQARVNAALSLGGRLDGKIQYETHGAVAAVRAPDGHMIGMYERASGR